MIEIWCGQCQRGKANEILQEQRGNLKKKKLTDQTQYLTRFEPFKEAFHSSLFRGIAWLPIPGQNASRFYYDFARVGLDPLGLPA